jgi:hypothetical protein
MFAHRFCVRAAFGRPLAMSARNLTALAVVAAVLAACSQVPQPSAGADPSDPRSSARPMTYRSVIGPYESQRPVEPAPWRDQNERITPPAKP